MKTIKLNNNIDIPLVGIGTNTFGKVDNQYQHEINFDTKELDMAIGLGYRLIDTAISYRNEMVIGDAVLKSGIKREAFVLTTKIPGELGYTTKTEVENAVSNSLKHLKTDYLDIMLIHHPHEDIKTTVSVYQTLETLVLKGKIKTLGVSNFNIEQLEHLLKHVKIKPSINQIASYPGHWQDELIAYCQKEGIVVQAWSPLNRIKDDTKKTLQEIANRYHKTWAQVVLNYQIGRNVIVLPKSHRKAGQIENIDIFDFELTTEERKKINKL